jgi:uncharacterized protein (DUF1330 family)
MSVYFIANICVLDQNEYNKYVEKVDSVFSKFNGRYLVVDENPEVLEGEWNYSRVILIEFPDKESLRKWYTSNEYQDILKHRLSSAKCDTLIVEDLRKDRM